MNTSTKLELLRRSVGPWYVAVFSSFQMFFLLVCCHHLVNSDKCDSADFLAVSGVAVNTK